MRGKKRKGKIGDKVILLLLVFVGIVSAGHREINSIWFSDWCHQIRI